MAGSTRRAWATEQLRAAGHDPARGGVSPLANLDAKMLANKVGSAGMKDALDVIVDQWRRERPDLDPAAKEVTGRIIRLASMFGQAYDETFARLGVTDADYGVLAPLRRSGEPYELTPTELARDRMVTSGGMTAALDRLERKGLVVRVPNPADRRGSLVRLTSAGLAVVDEAMTEHAATEQRLVEALTPSEQVRASRLLRKLLIALEQPPTGA